MPMLAVHDTPAGNMYEANLDLPPIQGESTSAAHPNTIEISGFSFVINNTPVRTAGGSNKGGKPSISEISVTKSVDKASTQLRSAATSGQIIKTGTITWSKSTGGKRPEDYLSITLTNVLVTSVQLTSPGGQGIGAESVSLSFDTIAMDYKVQGANGLLTSAGQWSYNLAAGT